MSSESAGPGAVAQNIRQIPIDRIRPGPQQARRHFDADALAELAASIAESGVIQPVVLRSSADGYELLAGERRWRASQLARQEFIPALIRDDLSNDEARVLGLVENLQRESLTITETAEGLHTLGERFGLTHDGIAARIGKSRVYVTNYLRILKLDQRVRRLLDEGRLSLGHAKILAGLPPHLHIALAQEAVRLRLSVRALERRCARARDADTAGAPAAADADADLRVLEDALADLVGNPVCVLFDKASGKGSLRIDFGDLAQLQGILERLGYRPDGHR